MEMIGSSGYLLSACAYLLFILLLLAARNQTLTGRLVLLASFLVFSSSIAAALQPKQGFSLMIILLFETFKLATWSVLILCTQNNISSLKGLFSEPKIQKYLLTWLALSLSCWAMVILLPTPRSLTA